MLHVVLGELAPKAPRSPAPRRSRSRRRRRCAPSTWPPSRSSTSSTASATSSSNHFASRPASEAGHAPHSEDELRERLRENREGGLIDREEQQLSEAALVFGDRRAREVMTPRSEIDFETIAEPPRDIAERAMHSGHTRLPLCDAGHGLEDAVGFINAKDLVRIAFGQPELARPLARVAESTRLDEVLRAMRRDRRHLAPWLDEHGTVVGLITLEDILEERVGEIEDEFDPHTRELIRAGDGGLRIDGAAPLRLVAERLGMDVDAPHEATIGGHVAERLGRLPDPDEVVDIDGARLTVLAVDDTRITALRA
jgi:CBS domain containing-hemolysin-like protein